MKCPECKYVNTAQAKSCEACGQSLQLTPEENAELAQEYIKQISKNASINALAPWFLIKKIKWLIIVLLISLIGWYSYHYIQDYWELDQEKQQRLEKQHQKQAALRKRYPNGIPLPQMISISAGSFQMGSTERNDEEPVHLVSIPAFKMAQTETTWKQYQVCIDFGPCSSGDDAGFGKAERPVINVSWKDTKLYIGWINEQTGKNYRLPSESEWEYAARAGSTTKYSWGNSIGKNKANCKDCGSQWDNKKTAPVKSFKPNQFGLYDMHGNVWEWTDDCWNESYSGAPIDGSAWTTGDCGKRVLLGGSWARNYIYLRSAYRDWNYDSARYYSSGFRLVQD